MKINIFIIVGLFSGAVFGQMTAGLPEPAAAGLTGTSALRHWDTSHMLLSSYRSSSSGTGIMRSEYLGSATTAMRPNLKLSIDYGYDLASYNPLDGFSAGSDLSLDNLRGVSLRYTGPRNSLLTIQYGMSKQSTQRLHATLFSDPFAFSTMEKNPGYSLDQEYLDSLSIMYNKTLFGDKLNITAVIHSADTGLR